MKKIFSLFLIAIGLIPIISSVTAASLTNKGFDGSGYNYQARIFVGAANGIDRIIDGKVWGDPTYAKDHLKMTWSKAWDEARFHGAPWTCDAWEDNQWNGMKPDGSQET